LRIRRLADHAFDLRGDIVLRGARKETPGSIAIAAADRGQKCARCSDRIVGIPGGAAGEHQVSSVATPDRRINPRA
jgi:hypothetical protein